MQAARDEIRASWRRTCTENADHPRAGELFDPDRLPAFHDPFAGGGALPLEAQRLGLEAHASDLNPVAVLINKAIIEIPPKFADRPPVNPEARPNTPVARESLIEREEWKGAQGPGRGCALLRPMDARRGREAYRATASEGRGHRGDDAGATGPGTVRGPRADRHRVAVGARSRARTRRSGTWTYRWPRPSCSRRRRARRRMWSR